MISHQSGVVLPSASSPARGVRGVPWADKINPIHAGADALRRRQAGADRRHRSVLTHYGQSMVLPVPAPRRLFGARHCRLRRQDIGKKKWAIVHSTMRSAPTA